MELFNLVLHPNFILASQLAANSNNEITEYSHHGSDIYTLEALVDTLEEAASYLKLLH